MKEKIELKYLGEKITLFASHLGCEHYAVRVMLPSESNKLTTINLAVDGVAKNEQEVLQKRFYAKRNNNEIIKPKGTTLTIQEEDVDLYFGELKVGEIKNGTLNWEPRTITLPEARHIGDANTPKTTTSSYLDTKKAHNPDHPRIDGHTHYIAAFPMKVALEKAMAEKTVYIPSIVVLEILKDKKILDDQNKKDFLTFLKSNGKSLNQHQSPQKDFSSDLINEDFKTSFEEEDSEACKAADKKVNYIDLKLLKNRLGNQWGNFCNGFDLDATHPCDFTYHMEKAYNLRNWFGKDPYFMREQLETIYEEYTKNGIDYAELPAGYFKNEKELKQFLEYSTAIEKQRKSEDKTAVTLRPGLSIARLIKPSVFRDNLFSYIPLILQYPDLASVTVLAHETNPTTEHIRAIQEFVEIINEVRPGFTVELHAGETSAYGGVNMREAYSFAKKNPALIIRAGHAIYGAHNREILPNFIEEKCPLSNATLIDVEPEAQVDVILGIVNGNSQIFWGSDGVLYNPDYGPNEQEHFFHKVISSSKIKKELERRWKEKGERGDFDAYFQDIQGQLIEKIKANKEKESEYIDFKKHEKEFHALKINIVKLKLAAQLGQANDHDKEMFNEAQNKFNEIGTHPNAYKEFQSALKENYVAMVRLNELCQQALKDKNLSDARIIQELMPDKAIGRIAVGYFNQLYKLEQYISDKPNDIIDLTQEQIKAHRKLLENAYKDRNLASLASAYKTLSIDEREKISNVVLKLRGKLIQPENRDLEIILNPDYEFDKRADEFYKENQQLLKANQTKNPKIQEGIVLFGSPEVDPDKEGQEAYMKTLYDTLYCKLINATNTNKSIILLGGVSEGINPLIYRILYDHPKTFKSLIPAHIVPQDESVSLLKHDPEFMKKSSPNGYVPYIISSNDSKRQETHISYACKINEIKPSEVLMVGGGMPVWSDTKIILLEKGCPVKYYKYGFKQTRTSSEFADGNPEMAWSSDNQLKDEQLKSSLNQYGKHLTHQKYFDQLLKTSIYEKNLGYTYDAIRSLVNHYRIQLPELSKNDFISAFFSTSLAALENRIECQQKVNEFFEGLSNLDDSELRKIIQTKILRLLKDEKGFGVFDIMRKEFPEFDWSTLDNMSATISKECDYLLKEIKSWAIGDNDKFIQGYISNMNEEMKSLNPGNPSEWKEFHDSLRKISTSVSSPQIALIKEAVKDLRGKDTFYSIGIKDKVNGIIQAVQNTPLEKRATAFSDNPVVRDALAKKRWGVDALRLFKTQSLSFHANSIVQIEKHLAAVQCTSEEKRAPAFSDNKEVKGDALAENTWEGNPVAYFKAEIQASSIEEQEHLEGDNENKSVKI